MKWKPEEDALLLKVYLDSKKEELLIYFPNRTYVAIKQRALFLGLVRDDSKRVSLDEWKEEEILILKENYLIQTKEFFSEKLPNRTWKSIVHKALKLGIYKNEKNKEVKRIPWTEEELNIVKKEYQHNLKEYIISLLPNRTWKAIREKANFLNIARDESLIRQETTENLAKSNIKNYGVVSLFQTEELKEIIKKKNLDNLGVAYPMQSKEVQQKSKDTCLKNWNVENPFQSKELQEKSKNTMIEKYGASSPIQSKELKEKIDKTNLDKYGVVNPFQSKELQEKSKQTLLAKYGKQI